MKTYHSLCYVIKDGKVLLQKKRKERFSGGKWNAPGGKIKPGETPVQAVVREIREETGLDISSPKHVGLVDFSNGKGKGFVCNIFTAEKFSGTLKLNGEEGGLKWFPAGKIPYQEMWEDDIHWVPHALKGEKFIGTFMFDEDFKKMVSHSVEML